MTCMSFSHRIGEMLRTRRLDCGLSQDAVAQMVSIPAASLSRIENGHQAILFETFLSLAHVLDMDDMQLKDLMTPTSLRPLWERVDE